MTGRRSLDRGDIPSDEQIARVLAGFTPRPSREFDERMRRAPWRTGRGRLPLRRWATVLAMCALALLLSSSLASGAIPLTGWMQAAQGGRYRNTQAQPQSAGSVSYYYRLDANSRGMLAQPAPGYTGDTRLYATGPCCSTGGVAPVNGRPYDANFFENYGTNPFIDTEDNTLSTFAMDVDTASYALIRQYLADGYLPDKDAVRVEEVVNYFDMHYPDPKEGAFGITLEAAPSPFGGERYWLVKIGLQGRRVEAAERRDAALTFVIDSSGSMRSGGRLENVKAALRVLVEQLRPGDQVAIVAYSDTAWVVLNPTPAGERETILAAVDQLQPTNATNAEAGLLLGYQLAAAGYRADASNQLILCSDGVANVGNTGAGGILTTVEEYAAKGIGLSTVGFGIGNYNDVLLEQLADKGDGRYAYVDTLDEAQRIFVENLTGTLQTIARDAKVQVEFNTAVVSRFRLLGYENRYLADEQFRDDTVDAGEVGAGHSVTALYEVKLQDGAELIDGNALTVYVRYLEPEALQAFEQSQALARAQFLPAFESASPEFRLAAAAAEFAEILRGSYWAKESTLAGVLPLARSVLAEREGDADAAEFVRLVERAASLTPPPNPLPSPGGQ